MKRIAAILCTLLTCMTGCVSVPTDKFTESLRASDGYLHIRTRIVIAEKDGCQVRSIEEVQEEIKNCETVFRDMKIKFDIAFVGCIEDNKDFDYYNDNAEKYYKTLSIYYVYIPNRMYKGKEQIIYGLSSMANQGHNAILIAEQHKNKWTLAHEVGHWGGGLDHVFDPDDGVEDTPRPPTEDTADPSMFWNVMNYANDADRKSITPGQLEKFRANFLAYRWQYISK